MTTREKLIQAQKKDKLPKITVYNRIDGPGSSLDLRLFQQAMWHMIGIPEDPFNDSSMAWSKGLPRTLGITIDVGTEITAEPAPEGKLGIESVDFGFSYLYDKDEIPPIKENWLLKIMGVFNLSGVKFVTRNLFPELKSAALGGSASVTTGVAILANKLAREKFDEHQLVGLASVMEHDLEVSITGTQEQSNVVFGGVVDYIWFPWGIPGEGSFYGTSIRQEILKEADYQALKDRLDLYFLMERFSGDVNSVWHQKLKKVQGFKLHRKKIDLAYDYKEALRTKSWEAAVEPIRQYREIRTQLCENYMSKPAWEIEEICQKYDAASFPVGGGGGSSLVYSPDPKILTLIRNILKDDFKLIDYQILPYGHKVENLEGFLSK